mmetsp:Transcript_3/g.10  ORF Transcript_3/g.10 Transcript_3/m.10 type:complete len:243 (-) Transcript_3:96-824(-)
MMTLHECLAHHGSDAVASHQQIVIDVRLDAGFDIFRQHSLVVVVDVLTLRVVHAAIVLIVVVVTILNVSSNACHSLIPINDVPVFKNVAIAIRIELVVKPVLASKKDGDGILLNGNGLNVLLKQSWQFTQRLASMICQRQHPTFVPFRDFGRTHRAKILAVVDEGDVVLGAALVALVCTGVGIDIISTAVLVVLQQQCRQQQSGWSCAANHHAFNVVVGGMIILTVFHAACGSRHRRHLVCC